MTLASIVWNVDPVLIHLGPLEIRWYGLMWGLGFILAYEIVSRLFKKEGYPENWADKLFILHTKQCNRSPLRTLPVL